MKLLYDAATDSLYIKLKAEPGADTREIEDGVLVDVAADGSVVGIDIEHASRPMDLSEISASGLPLAPAAA